eukprot:scaffold1709_cov158-Ochromonas_danica.AAC.19
MLLSVCSNNCDNACNGPTRTTSFLFQDLNLMNSTNTSGYGFVSYETTEEALRAVQVMRQTLLDGIAYDCKFSKAFTESFGQLSLPPHVETSPIVWVPPMPMYPTFYPTFPPSFQQLPHLPSPLAFPQPYPPALPNAVTQQTSSAYPQMPVIHPLAPPPPLLLPQHHHQPHHQHQPQYQHQHQTRSPPLLYSYNNFPQGGHHVVQTPPYYWLGP